jgi:hypothetical protein
VAAQLRVAGKKVRLERTTLATRNMVDIAALGALMS